ncbi:hypothetical protein [Campylobacter sp. RM12651]|uniref:hypothetical protein n=1 Tax=Campylobacter sp. RM12651 TaxID=1660079 RepID=UPI001EFB7C08|nr:hypothetical protein [Campylobacter sp. RM12651]ULO03802.1 hypothetical protein AVBRAN_1348 [Campylobacter sp. RM12651]
MEKQPQRLFMINYLAIFIFFYLLFLMTLNYLNSNTNKEIFLFVNNDTKQTQSFSFNTIKISNKELATLKDKYAVFSLPYFFKGEKLYICEFGSINNIKTIEDTICYKIINEYHKNIILK